MDDMTVADSKANAENQALADIYGFLALTMRYPGPLQESEAFKEGFEGLLETLGWMDKLATLRIWRRASRHPLESLQIEYTRLFINAAPRVIAPPYASVYRNGDSSIYGKPTENTRDFYRQCGFDLNTETEPPDHLQHELSLLAALVGESRYAEEETFLRFYFRPWFTPFSSKVLQETEHPFYRISVQLIDFFYQGGTVDGNQSDQAKISPDRHPGRGRRAAQQGGG